MSNPFLVGPVVTPEKFINRRSEIRRAISLLTSGQSLALVGPPRSGKTSLLHYLMDNSIQNNLYGPIANNQIFVYIDAQVLGDDMSRSRFWEQVIQSLVYRLPQESPLHETVHICRQNDFGTFVMEQLFAQMRVENRHLILFLDEFDTILEHPRLNQTEFYGGLRSLASRYGKSFTLVTASRQSLSALNENTQEFTRTGSPFFNFMSEIPLLPFEEKHAKQTLLQAEDRFGKREIQGLINLVGGHPYLLQAAGSALWECHEDKCSPAERATRTGHELLRTVYGTLDAIWRFWNPATRRIFAIIALDEMPTLISQRNFDLETLRRSLSNYPREISFLEEQGFVVSDKLLPCGWRVSAQVMLWWMAEELLTALRKNDELGQLLTQNEWDGLFTKGEKQQFVFAISEVGKMAKTGTEVFIKAAAEGLGKGLSGIK